MNYKSIQQVALAISLLSLFSLKFATAEQPLELNQQERLAQNVDFLNELSSRRQINTHFINEQSATYGLQKGKVNVGRGNYTFLRKDMVIIDRLPLTIARVYDSSQLSGGDFGYGWHLNIAESITKTSDNKLSYFGEHAFSTTLIFNGKNYIPENKFNTDIKYISINDIGALELFYRDGKKKVFEHIGEKYCLTKVVDSYGNEITVNYDSDKIVSAKTAANYSVQFHRNSEGYINRLTSSHGSNVSYAYDNSSNLVSVTDIGDNQWQYKYNGRNQLTQITNPNGATAAKIAYGKEGRVVKSSTHLASLRFNYNKNITTVTEGANSSSSFEQGALGITVAVINALGLESRLDVNSLGHIQSLKQNGQVIADYQYGEEEKLEKVMRYNQSGSLIDTYSFDSNERLTSVVGDSPATYTYDTKGRVLKAIESDVIRQYTYDEYGNMLSVTINNDTTNFAYNSLGLNIKVSNEKTSTSLEYSELGYLAKIIFADGTSHSYAYDKLGFRKYLTRSDNSSIEFNYDAVGNLNGLSKVLTDKTTTTAKYTLSKNNQITRIDWSEGEPLSIDYDNKGNPIKASRDTVEINYGYDKLGRLNKVQGETEGELNYRYKDDELDIRLQLDSRTAPAYGRYKNQSHSYQLMSNARYTRSYGNPLLLVGWNDSFDIMEFASSANRFIPDNQNQCNGQYSLETLLGTF